MNILFPTCFVGRKIGASQWSMMPGYMASCFRSFCPTRVLPLVWLGLWDGCTATGCRGLRCNTSWITLYQQRRCHLINIPQRFQSLTGFAVSNPRYAVLRSACFCCRDTTPSAKNVKGEAFFLLWLVRIGGKNWVACPNAVLVW